VPFGESTRVDGLEVYLFEAEHPTLTPELQTIMAQWGGAVPSRNGGFVVCWKDFSLCLLGDCIYSSVFGEVGKRYAIDIAMIPIQGKKFTAELLFGTAYARAKWLCFKSVEYMFDIEEGEFTSLARNYQLIKDTHFGYQVGLWISFCPLKNVGLDLNLRIQDLSNGGTFFFVGGGFCFNL